MRISDWSSDVCSSDLLSRGEEEFDVGGWLLQRFQERVEPVLGQHVDFVDNVDLVPRRDGGIAYGLDNFAHIVHAGMGGGVHLYDVDKIGRAHVCTPVTNAHLVCRILLENKKKHNTYNIYS